MLNPDAVLWRVLSDDAHAAFALVDYSLRIHTISRRAASLLNLPAGGDEGLALPDATPGSHGCATLPRSDALRRAILEHAPAYAEETHTGVRYRVSYRPFPPSTPNATPNLCIVLWTPIAALPPELIDAQTLGPNPRRRSRYAGLNETDVAVLRLIADGLTTAQIAQRLSRSVKTIEWRRMAIGRKLNASNRVDLALLALRLGIIPLEPFPPAVPTNDRPHPTAPRRTASPLRPLATTGPSSRQAS